MAKVKLDHVTIRTSDLDETLRFYGHFFGLKPGARPPFSVGGAWLYPEDDDYPILHVIETNDTRQGNRDHFAFRMTNLESYLAKVKASGAIYMAIPLPETDLVQVQHRDPNGLLVEATFGGEPIDVSEIREGAVPE